MNKRRDEHITRIDSEELVKLAPEEDFLDTQNKVERLNPRLKQGKSPNKYKENY